ncbi:hypothetical protein [Gemmiger formicilis]|uniref:hypothetical protein n=1 Tax=Gemmiger formicilis TaxID=745368 RepID=UPI0035210022
MHKPDDPHGGQRQQYSHSANAQETRDPAEIQHDHRAAQYRQRQQGGGEGKPLRQNRTGPAEQKQQRKGRRVDAAWA